MRKQSLGRSGQDKVLVPTHNLAILPATSLLFHGRPLLKRLDAPITRDDVPTSSKTWSCGQTLITAEETRAQSRNSPHAPVRRLCRENGHEFRSCHDRRRRKFSAVVLPRILYDGDTSSEDGELIETQETTSTGALNSQVKKEKKREDTIELTQRKTMFDPKTPVDKMSSTFNIEKMTLRTIPIVEVKDLRESHSEYPLRDRKERKIGRSSKNDAQRTYRSNFSTPLDTENRHEQDDYKYRMPHLDDNVLTMMNSTPFWKKRNQSVLKPPQSLESIRAQISNKHSDGIQEEKFDDEDKSYLKFTKDRLFPAVPPQSPVEAEVTEKSRAFCLIESESSKIISSSTAPFRQTEHPNAFVRNSSDFCTPFCSNFLDMDDILHEITVDGNVLVGDQCVTTTGTPSARDYSEKEMSMGCSKRFEKTFKHLQNNVENVGHVNGNADFIVSNDQSCGCEKSKADVTKTIEHSRFEKMIRYGANRTIETTSSPALRCSSPHFTATILDRMSFPQLPNQRVRVFDSPRRGSSKDTVVQSAARQNVIQKNDGRSITCETIGKREGQAFGSIHRPSSSFHPTEKCATESNTAEVVHVLPLLAHARISLKEDVQENTNSPRKRENLEQEGKEKSFEVDSRHVNAFISSDQSTFMTFTEEASFTNGNNSCSVTRSLSFSQRQALDKDCVRFASGDNLRVMSSEETRQKITNHTACVLQFSKNKSGKSDSIRTNSNSAPKASCADIQADQQYSSHKQEKLPSKKRNINTHKQNTHALRRQDAAKGTKPPLRHRMRYKNLSKNPHFVMFRSKECSSSKKEPETFSSDSEGVEEEEEGLKMADTLFLPLEDSSRLSQSLAPNSANPDSVHEDSGGLNRHLMARITDLERLRGYGGVEVANLGLQEYYHDLNVRQRCNGWPNSLRHNNTSQSHPCYDDFENKRHRRYRKLNPQSALSGSDHCPHQQRKIGIKNRSTKPHEKASYNETAACKINFVTLHYPTKLGRFSRSSKQVASTGKSYPPLLNDKARSKMYQSDEPRLFHHPSCPDVQNQRSQAQHRHRNSGQMLKNSTPESCTLSEALKARIAFNNMRLIHNARQGAFSKFYFSKIDTSVSTRKETLEHLDIPDNEDQGEIFESGEVPEFQQVVQPSNTGGDFSGQKCENRLVKRHSVFSSLMTPHELTMTSQEQKEERTSGGIDVVLKGTSW